MFDSRAYNEAPQVIPTARPFSLCHHQQEMELASFSAAAGDPRGVLFPVTSIRASPPVTGRNTQASLGSNPYSRRSLLGLRYAPELRLAESRVHPAAPRCAGWPGDGENDPWNLEKAFTLYKALKEGNVQEVSDLIGEKSPPLHDSVYLEGKKRVLQLFSSVTGLLRNNMEIVIKPTKHEGTDVGIAWRLDWKKARKPSGRGYSFNTSHRYQGKMFLRNVEMFFEPIAQIASLRLKLVEFVRSNLNQIAAANVFKEKRRAGCMLLLALLLIMGFSFMVVMKFPHRVR